MITPSHNPEEQNLYIHY